MKSRFHLPSDVHYCLSYKGRNLRFISGHELTEVYDRLRSLDQRDSLKVTVAVPAYNEESNLFAMLKSISRQETRLAVEVIVVDNRSMDRTAELAEKCGAVVVKENKRGVAHARQAALEEATGQVLVTCDADTIYPPHWLETMVYELLVDERNSVVYSLHCLYDEEGRYPLSHFVYQYLKLAFVWVRSINRGQLNAGGASMAFKTSLAKKVGGYNTELSRGEDGYLALKLSKFGKVRMIKSPKAFIYTSNRRVLADGSTMRAFVIRARKGLRHSISFLTKQQIPES